MLVKTLSHCGLNCQKTKIAHNVKITKGFVNYCKEICYDK